MAIKITVSDKVAFQVKGTINDELGAAKAFEFTLIARRLSSDDLKAKLADTSLLVPDFLADVVTGWRKVTDDNGVEVEFTPLALQQLFQITGLAGLAFRRYLEEAGAKEKN